MGKAQNGSFVWLLRQSGERKGKFTASGLENGCKGKGAI